ncbi:putative transcription factor B3-Domain family [Helianthus annuus]|nr:putative transcription factor B3-Domain family [Helianthus annuus]
MDFFAKHLKALRVFSGDYSSYFKDENENEHKATYKKISHRLTKGLRKLLVALKPEDGDIMVFEFVGHRHFKVVHTVRE